MKFCFLGDIHGNFDFYFKWLSQKDHSNISIQLGDLGLGFIKEYDDKYIKYIKKYSNDYFIRGNHDSPKICKQQKKYLGDYGIFKNKIFYVSGAYSIDYKYRTPGIDWWYDEEISTDQCNDCIKLYKNNPCNIIISHDCPKFIKDMIITTDNNINSRTNILLEELWNIHKPSWFIFCHYHISKQFKYLNTNFKCLNIQESFILDL